MKKLLRIATLFSIVFLTPNAYSMSPEEFISSHEANLIKYCEAENAETDDFRDNSVIMRLLQLPSRYECGLVQFYAVRKNVQHQINMGNDADAWEVFKSLMDENYIEEFDTYDFMTVNIEYEKWLENTGQGEE